MNIKSIARQKQQYQSTTESIMNTREKLQTMTFQDFKNMTPKQEKLFNLNLEIEKLEILGHDATESIKEKEELEYRISPDIVILN